MALALLAPGLPGPVLGHGPLPSLGRPEYRDVTVAAGLGGFRHAGFLGAPGEPAPLFPEITGSGACWFNADGDDDLDLYLVNGLYLRQWEQNAVKDPRSHLYLNDGDGTFTDAGSGSGARLQGLGQGCAAADYDDDGDADLLMTQFGGNVLLRNRGDGIFDNVTAAANIRDERCGAFLCWATSASWLDYDRDGCLDLYVARFGDYDIEDPPPGGNGPEQAPGQLDSLYRSRCDGTFDDVAAAAGIAEKHNGWGVVSGDYDANGWPDLFVANDGDVNDVYLNRGDGTFRRKAFDERHGMGVAHGDPDHDGDLDVVVTNFVGEHNGLFLNGGDGLAWTDVGDEAPFTDAWDWSGWATQFFDAHNDGHADLMVLNGMTEDVGNIPLKEPVLFYENLDGQGAWSILRDDVGYAVQRDYVARGGAWGDYDDDGDIDVLIAEAGENPTHLLRAKGAGGNFLNLDLLSLAPGSVRDAIGARVSVRAPGLMPQMQEKVAGSGFLGSNDPRLHFGLGREEAADVEVRWPDGSVQAWTGLRANIFARLTQGVAGAEVLRALPIVALDGPTEGRRLAPLRFEARVEVAPGQGPAEVRWELGDGRTAQGLVVEHAFLDVGEFIVRAIATDAQGRSKAQALRVVLSDTLHARIEPYHDPFLPVERMTGDVVVTFSNGDPVRGAAVDLVVTYATGTAEVDAFFAAQPAEVRSAVGYGTRFTRGPTDAEGRFAFWLPYGLAPDGSELPVNHPGQYAAVATGSARGSTFEPAPGAWQVGARLP